MRLSKMNIKQLEDEINAYEDVFQNGCYGTKDLRWLDSLYNEASNRGYGLRKKVVISLVKKEEGK